MFFNTYDIYPACPGEHNHIAREKTWDIIKTHIFTCTLNNKREVIQSSKVIQNLGLSALHSNLISTDWNMCPLLKWVYMFLGGILKLKMHELQTSYFLSHCHFKIPFILAVHTCNSSYSGRRKQVDHKLEVSLGYLVRCYLKR